MNEFWNIFLFVQIQMVLMIIIIPFMILLVDLMGYLIDPDLHDLLISKNILPERIYFILKKILHIEN